MMKTPVLEKISSGHLFFDGACGSELARQGLPQIGQSAEALSITHPEVIRALHGAYIAAGSDIISANTFGANVFKESGQGFSLEEVIRASLSLAQDAIQAVGGDRYAALDVGPSGRLMQPYGDVSFDEMYENYRRIVRCGAQNGADLILFETFTDLYELKTAILAARENTDLPVFATMTLEKNLHTMTGSDVAVIAAVLQSLGVAAMGLNCSMGPSDLQESAAKMLETAALPVLIQPNAGLPEIEDGKVAYRVDPEAFAAELQLMAQRGVSLFGGCCGTTPAHIRQAKQVVSAVPFCPQPAPAKPCICSLREYRECDDPSELNLFTIPVGPGGLDESRLAAGDYSAVGDLAFDALDDEADAIVLRFCAPVSDPAGVVSGLLSEIAAAAPLPVLLQCDDAAIRHEYSRRVRGVAVFL